MTQPLALWDYFLRIVVRRLLECFIPPRAEPTAEKGSKEMKNKARSPAGIAIPLRPIMKATRRMESSNSAPERSPDEREAPPDSLAEMNPQATAEMHRSAVDKGIASRAGSAVRKMAAVTKKVKMIAPARASAAEMAECFSSPKVSEPSSRPLVIACLRFSNAFFDESI